MRQHAKDGDIRIDYDALACTIAGITEDNHQHSDSVHLVTRKARQAAIDAALKGVRDVDVWIIHSTPAPAMMAKYRQVGAEVHVVDPGKDVVMSRVKHQRPEHMLAVAASWYARQAKGQASGSEGGKGSQGTQHWLPTAKPRKPRANAAERGYGSKHVKTRRKLLAQLVDGSPCPWCGKPLHKRAEANWDHAPLEADHSKALKHHGPGDADRLLHRHCNRSRADGRDDRKPDAQSEVPAAPFVWG